MITATWTKFKPPRTSPSILWICCCMGLGKLSPKRREAKRKASFRQNSVTNIAWSAKVTDLFSAVAGSSAHETMAPETRGTPDRWRGWAPSVAASSACWEHRGVLWKTPPIRKRSFLFVTQTNQKRTFKLAIQFSQKIYAENFFDQFFGEKFSDGQRVPQEDKQMWVEGALKKDKNDIKRG